MPHFNLFSKRNSELPDIYVYDKLSHKLKIQIFHIWSKFFRQQNIREDFSNRIFEEIDEILCEEHGLKKLWHPPFNGGLYISGAIYSSEEKIEKFIEGTPEIEKQLDAIELLFYFIENIYEVNKNFHGIYNQLLYAPQQAIEDLNHRFKENGVGYEFSNGKIIRVDTQLLHNEIIRPALNLLNNNLFKNANDEYLSAHEHYRHQRNKECLNDCLKSFETTMKIICEKNSWSYDKKKDTASKLISICIENGLVPEYLSNFLVSVRTILETGIPTVRNKNSGHGQGIDRIIVPDFLASFLLYLTGTCIIFLIEADKNK